VRIFIQAHNEKTFALAKYRFGQYWWAYPILVPGADTLNPLCENKMIVEYKTILKGLYEDFDFIGTMAYSATTKIDMNAANKLINSGVIDSFYHFAVDDHSIENSTAQNHPNFMTIWARCCEPLLGSAATVKHSKFNYWVCSKELFCRYSDFLTTTLMPILAQDPLIETDARYCSGAGHNVQKLNGKPYYTHWPFILERVWYAYMNTLQIIHQ
jgi:hypothetical protein